MTHLRRRYTLERLITEEMERCIPIPPPVYLWTVAALLREWETIAAVWPEGRITHYKRFKGREWP